MIEQPYIDIYNNHKETISKNSAPVLNKLRDEAFAQFEKIGFPTSRMENFLYTNLQDSFAYDYGINFHSMKSSLNPYEIFRCGVHGINSHLFFVVNNQFYANDGIQASLPEGVVVGSLKEIAATKPELVKKYYGQIADQQDGTVAFNTSFAQDGFFLYVPKGVVIEKPIQLVNLMQADVDLLANSRNLIVIEEGAQAKILVCAHTLNKRKYLANRVTEVFVGKHAIYEHYKLENTSSKTTNIGSLFIKQEESSNVRVNEVTLHNGLTRNNVNITFDGEHAETVLCGMSIGDKNQHIDNYTNINHAKANCKSTELYKYVLNETSQGAFSGRILVAKDAQKTEAYQTNKNICLTKEARMRTKPQLEIYADDVKCSHGATVGQIDDNALFYLRSRGISEPEARMLLIFAFVDDVIENIKIPALQESMRQLVEKRFRGDLSKCEACAICN